MSTHRRWRMHPEVARAGVVLSCLGCSASLGGSRGAQPHPGVRGERSQAQEDERRAGPRAGALAFAASSYLGAAGARRPAAAEVLSHSIHQETQAQKSACHSHCPLLPHPFLLPPPPLHPSAHRGPEVPGFPECKGGRFLGNGVLPPPWAGLVATPEPPPESPPWGPWAEFLAEELFFKSTHAAELNLLK